MRLDLLFFLGSPLAHDSQTIVASQYSFYTIRYVSCAISLQKVPVFLEVYRHLNKNSFLNLHPALVKRSSLGINQSLIGMSGTLHLRRIAKSLWARICPYSDSWWPANGKVSCVATRIVIHKCRCGQGKTKKQHHHLIGLRIVKEERNFPEKNC